jgi:hypothetical protein
LDTGLLGRGKKLLSQPLSKWLIVGLAIRFILAPFLGHYYDSGTFMVVGAAVAHGQSPYDMYRVWDYFPNVNLLLYGNPQGYAYGVGYPPFWGLLLGGLYAISYPLTQSLYTYNLALKLPIIVGDVAFAFLLQMIVVRVTGDPATGRKAAAIWFLNPFTIIVGVVWGMFDVLPLTFILASAYLLYLGRWRWSAVALALANEFKPIGLVLIPILFVYAWRVKSLRRAFYFSFLTLGIFLGITYSILLGLGWPLGNFTASQTYQVSGVLGGGSLYLPYVAYYFLLHGVDPTYFAPILGILWLPAIAAVMLVYMYRGKRDTFTALLFWSVLSVAVSYAARTFVDETQFLIPISLLLVFAVCMKPPSLREFLLLTGVMTAFVLVHFPPIYFTWIGNSQAVDAVEAFTTSPFWGEVRWLVTSFLVYLYTVHLARYLWRARSAV